MNCKSVESDVNETLQRIVAEIAPGFPVIPLRGDFEKQDRFIAVETGLLKQEAPGFCYYQLPVAIHIGTRAAGDGGDAKEDVLDGAYAAIRAYFASPKRRFQVRHDWFVVGIVPVEPQQNQDDTHNVRVLAYNLFIINKEI